MSILLLGIRHSCPLSIRLSRRLFSHRGPLGIMLGIRHSGPLGIRLNRRLFSHRASSGPMGILHRHCMLISRNFISRRGPLGIRLSRRLISRRGSSGPLGILHSRHSRRGPLALGIRLSRRLISQVRESKLAANNIQHQNQPGPGIEAVLLIQSLHRYHRLQFSTLGAR